MPNRTSAPARLVSRTSRTSRTGATRRNRPLVGPLPILTAALIWGTTGTAASLAPTGASAVGIGAAALVLGGLLLLLSTRSARNLPRACDRRERRLLALGAVAVVGYPVGFYPAVTRTGVAVATVIALGSAPVFAGLLGWLARQGRPSGRWAGATATAVLGCAVLVLGPQLDGGATTVDLVGVLLAALAGLSYAAYSLVGSELITRGHPSAGVMGAMFGGAALLVLPVLLLGDLGWLATARGAAVVFHLGVVTTFLAYRLFGHGLRHTSARTATTLTLAEPAVAALLGVVALGERLPAASWVGLAILAAAITVLTLPTSGRRRRPDRSPTT
ncbi:EamA family transporter [Kitasatospora sp. NPDC048538]|uniref:DMT family transporter n=1 Tax=unclassified Kitasatospora TaxID=2633591 RepID=UPI0033CF84F6